MNSSVSKPREDLRTRSTFTEHESIRSPLHSSQTLLQSSPGLVCACSRVSSSRQTRSNVARMSVSTLGVYSKSGSRIDFMGVLLGVLASRRVRQRSDVHAREQRIEHAPCVGAPLTATLKRKADRFALGGGPNDWSGHDWISRDAQRRPSVDARSTA